MCNLLERKKRVSLYLSLSFFLLLSVSLLLLINICATNNGFVCPQVVTNSPEEIANRGIELLKEVNTNLGPRLQSSVLAFHETYIAECMDRLKAHYDTVTVLSKVYLDGKEEEREEQVTNKIKIEAIKMCRVIKVLQEYINECDTAFPGERKILPLHR